MQGFFADASTRTLNMWSQERDGWGEYFAGGHLAQSRSTCQMKVGESGPSLGWNLGSTATPPPPPLSSVWKSTSTWCPLSWDFTDAGTLRYELGKGGSGSFLSDICYRSVWFDLVWFDLMWKGEGLQQVRRSRQAGLRLRALWCRLLWRLCLHQKGDNSIQNITKTNKIKLICLRLATGTRWFANRATTADCDSHKIVDCDCWLLIVIRTKLVCSNMSCCNQHHVPVILAKEKVHPTQSRLYTVTVQLENINHYQATQSQVCNNCDLSPCDQTNFIKGAKEE